MELTWFNMYHVYIFNEETKVFAWMIGAKNKPEAMRKTLHALAFYYPDIPIKGYLITIKKDEGDVLI